MGRGQYAKVSPSFLGVLDGKKAIWLHNPCLLSVAAVGGHQYGYIIPAFSWCRLWGDIHIATPALPSRGNH